MKDRVYGITQPNYYSPHPALVTAHVGNVMKAETNYAVFRTKSGSVSEVYYVGRYIDERIKKATPGNSGAAFACTTER